MVLIVIILRSLNLRAVFKKYAHFIIAFSLYQLTAVWFEHKHKLVIADASASCIQMIPQFIFILFWFFLSFKDCNYRVGSMIGYQIPSYVTSKMLTISQIFLTLILIWPTKTGWSKWQKSARTQFVIAITSAGTFQYLSHTGPGISDLPLDGIQNMRSFIK